VKPSWLRDVIHGGLVLLAAFLVHAALRWISVPFQIAIDVYAVAVIIFALVKGEIAGAVMGTAAGLVIDSFSLGVFGLAGIAATVTGYLTGYISRKINVVSPGRMFVFSGLMGLLDLALWVLLTSVFFGRGIPWGGGAALARPAATAVAVTLLYAAYRKFKARRHG
jgi:rod shape-determining protein MreD